MLRIAIGGLFVLMVAAGIGHGVFGWELTRLLPFLPGCAVREASGVPCPGCGMTRAFLLLCELRPVAAATANPAAPALLVAMAAWAVRRPRWSPRARDAAGAAALALLLLGWIVRTLPCELRLPL